MAAVTLSPGVSVRLKHQPAHWPDFWVVQCQRDLVWLRHLNWPSHLQICVRATQIAIADSLPQRCPLPHSVTVFPTPAPPPAAELLSTALASTP